MTKKQTHRILLLLLFLLLQSVAITRAQQVEYVEADSVRIVRLLSDAKNQRGSEHPMIWFGRQFFGLPYVAHTLENGDSEHLIVNIHGLDCTTFVETCAALSFCDAHDTRSFSDFCNALRMLRYRGGIIDAYPSRLHYFTQWGEDNERMGLVTSILESVDFNGFATQTVDVDYMTRHPDLYKQLKNHPGFIPAIRRWEEDVNGRKYRYLPKSKLNLPPSELSFIHTGDILSIITAKDGLDTSHITVAVWQDGRLGLMHASQLRKKVLIDPLSYYDYAQTQSHILGIRVYRLNLY